MNSTQNQPLKSLILTAWLATCQNIASGNSHQFSGQGKETKVLDQLRKMLTSTSSTIKFIGPYNQAKFESWEIDLVCLLGNEKIAIEGKYKIMSDGAIPDNRKEAFFDLYKLENYVNSGKYSSGLFLWLTNVPAYLNSASGDSTDFSTHQSRIYRANTPLTANRARRKMPLPLILKGQYVFNWQQVQPHSQWHTLVMEV
jgi:hypothetical protein